MPLLKKILSYIGRILLGIVLFTILWVIVYKWMNPPLTAIMLERKWQAWQSDKPARIYYDWVDYEDMSVYMPLAVIAAEDQNFSAHHGFDFKAIEKAIEYNHKKKKKRIRGASTISQQVAKNVFLWSGRTWFRKGLEVYFTFMIELVWGKKRIVEVYVNVAEMGPMTFGVGASSKKFFRTTPKRLSMEHAALLAAVLPNPRRFSAQRPSLYILNRKGWIMEQISHIGGNEYLKAIE